MGAAEIDIRVGQTQIGVRRYHRSLWVPKRPADGREGGGKHREKIVGVSVLLFLYFFGQNPNNIIINKRTDTMSEEDAVRLLDAPHAPPGTDVAACAVT